MSIAPRRSTLAAVLALTAALGVAFASSALAQKRPGRPDFWQVKVGSKAADLPSDGFVDFACGTNGGPPGLPLKGPAEFARCRAEPTGLYEVYLRYDDELEYWARALERADLVALYRGTQMYDFPVVLSLLVNAEGAVAGTRIVTDPRATDIRDRSDFWLLGTYLMQRFGAESWTCTDLPREEGENPVGTYYVKTRCLRTADGVAMMVERRLYQKRGQTFLDPLTGKPNPQAYESLTRFEMVQAPYAAKTGWASP
ncbi:MAG: hypothetical protein U1E56_01990 [Bauldia sp.]